MITAARPRGSESSHWYFPTGEACHEVPCKSRPGEMRATTVKDARAKNLLPSVTLITRLLHRPQLVEWQIEQAVLAAVSSPRREGEELDQFIERVLHQDREHEQERNLAADRGKEIHDALSRLMSEGVNYYPMLCDHIEAPAQFLRKIGRCMATERTVVGDGYAGTMDLLLQNDSELWVIDYKTTSKLPDKQYDENRLQLSAYSGTFGNVGDLRIRCANLYINTKEPGWKIIESPDWKSDYERFLLLARFFRLTNNLP